MSLKRTLVSVAISAIGLVAVSTAQADTLFTSAGFANISNPPLGALCSSCNGKFKVFDTFSLGSNATLTGVDFAVTASYGSNWNIEIAILDSTGATTLFSHIYAPENYSKVGISNDVTKIRASLPNVGLSSGSYWMSWYDSTGLAIPTYSDSGGQLYLDGAGGFKPGQSAAFQLTGNVAAVPEPETYAMMLAGLGVMGFIGKRRRNAI